MNKDVVYIEPEEDITDIIGKIEGAKSKIVALVPPKKAGVFKSIVNIKLIMKTGSNADKTVVLVTTDPAIIKLAAATKMPVTKDLKSAPAIPEPEEAEKLDDTEEVDVDDEAEEEEEEKKDDKEEKNKKSEKEEEGNDKDDDEEDDGDDDDDDDKDDSKKVDDKKANDEPKKSGGKLANSKNPVLRWIGTHKKADIGIGVGLVLLIIFAIWAFAIAPAVTVTLKLETVTGNFSENVSFTDKLADENVSEGKFFIEEKKVEDKAEVEFEATGKKNVGEKASGKITVYHLFKNGKGTVTVGAGSKFTYKNLTYVATEDTAVTWGGKDSECKNKSDDNIGTVGCYIYKDVNVKAAEPGTAYNIAATGKDGWAANSVVVVVSSTAMAGGTDKTITVVQQSDVDKAVNEINTNDDKDKVDIARQKIVNDLDNGQFAIESSFKQEASDLISSPKVGEEVEEGKKAKLTVNTTSTMFVMDETKLKEFIAEKAKLDKGFKIYEMKDPFVENFLKTDNGYIGKLKTSYVAGSTITENEVVDTIKGKGIGSAKRDLTDNFSGIKSIDISTSVPWVTSVPGNPEKITVIINTEADKKEE